MFGPVANVIFGMLVGSALTATFIWTVSGIKLDKLLNRIEKDGKFVIIRRVK